MRYFCLLVLLCSSFGALPQIVEIFNVSGLAIYTATVTVSSFLISIPILPRVNIYSFLSSTKYFATFLIIATLYLLFTEITPRTIISLVVWYGFYFLIFIGYSYDFKSQTDFKKIRKVFHVCVLNLTVISVTLLLLGKDAATYPMILVIFSTLYISSFKLFKKTSYLVILSTILILLALLTARMPFLILAGLIVLPAFWKSNLKLFATSIASILILVVLATLAFIYVDAFQQAFIGGDKAFAFGGVNINTSGRFFIWETMWESYKRNPIFGVGYDTPKYLIQVGQNHPHNDYLRILHSYGVVGLIMWLLFLKDVFFKIFKKCKRINDSSYTNIILNNMALYTLIFIVLSMITDNTIVYSFVMFPAGILIGNGIKDDV